MEKLAVNSFLSLGACDGPSVRSVIFLQGCPLRCDYCHNPETWEFYNDSSSISQLEDIDNLVNKILSYKSFYKNGGGVTVSGGEPLCQQENVKILFQKLKAHNIHTCLDTSGAVEVDLKLLEVTDLIICDLKFLTGHEYEKYTGKNIMNSLRFLLNLSNKLNIPVWIRHVIYPNVTDTIGYKEKIKEFCSLYSNVEKVEFLPLKKICAYKYKEMGLKFKLL